MYVLFPLLLGAVAAGVRNRHTGPRLEIILSLRF